MYAHYMSSVYWPPNNPNTHTYNQKVHKKIYQVQQHQRGLQWHGHRSSLWWSFWLAGQESCSGPSWAASVWGWGLLLRGWVPLPPTWAWRWSSGEWGSISTPGSASVCSPQCLNCLQGEITKTQLILKYYQHHNAINPKIH